MLYELWDVPTATLRTAFSTEEEALAFLRLTIAAYGEEFAAAYLLCEEDRYGRGRLIGEGQRLVALALASRQSPGRLPGDAP